MASEDFSSDEEAPVEESFAKTKVEADNVRNSILEVKRKEKEEIKLKRQKRQTLFVTQKQVKIARLEKQKEKLGLQEVAAAQAKGENLIDAEGVLPTSTENTTPIIQIDTNKKAESRRKFYKDLNIEVKTLSQLKNSRASAAIGFKAKRLAKPHRENVLINQVHLEKLKAAGKL